MNNAIAIALPANLPASQKVTALAVREIDNLDLYVNYVNNHPGHNQRIEDRRLVDALTRRGKVIPLKRA